MCKFTSRNAAGYKLVAATIRRYARKAPATVAARWVEARAQKASMGLDEPQTLPSHHSIRPSTSGTDPGLQQVEALDDQQRASPISVDQLANENEESGTPGGNKAFKEL